jgi:hypothetical protein
LDRIFGAERNYRLAAAFSTAGIINHLGRNNRMRVFTCQACGQLLYFENVRCESCGRVLGYLPDWATISALETAQNDSWSALGANGQDYRFCKNRDYGVCNWMVPADSAESFCAACRYNKTIPDLSVPENTERWRKLEAAKHRLLYTLLRLRLPMANRADDPVHGLAFAFLTDAPDAHSDHVMIGHDNGVITLAAKEADDAMREHIRTQMGEPYRTLLGHFRHESGHYFWDILVRDKGRRDSFRAVFGDEEQDYGAALQAHYAKAPGNWQRDFVSAYATAHPWEDFAETWAHYLHIVDTLETAQSFGVQIRPRPWRVTEQTAAMDFDPHGAASIEQLIAAWLPLSFAVNSLNRSMGQPDFYPFVLSPAAIAKLGYVHGLVHAA